MSNTRLNSSVSLLYHRNLQKIDSNLTKTWESPVSVVEVCQQQMFAH